MSGCYGVPHAWVYWGHYPDGLYFVCLRCNETNIVGKARDHEQKTTASSGQEKKAEGEKAEGG